MKTATSILLGLSITTAATTNSRAEWSFISLLRGEPEPPVYQRVAFLGAATVREVQGRAERLCGIDSWTPLKPGARIRPGDVVRTQKGTLVLRMDESDSYVRMGRNTVLRLAPVETQGGQSSVAIAAR